MGLEAHDLVVEIGGKRLLDSISIDLRRGRVACILGPNGAGKSTLLKALAGAMPPSRGLALMGGRRLQSWPREALARKRAVLSQSTALAFPFRVDEVVRLGRSPHAGRSGREEDTAVVEAALAAADVAHLAGRRYPTLSGGEQQRVQLARVLAQIMDGAGRFDGRWLMFDEPTSSLDLVHQHHVLTLARRVAASGGGVVAVLHDLNLAAAVADTLCLMLDQGPLARAGRSAPNGPVRGLLPVRPRGSALPGDRDLQTRARGRDGARPPGSPGAPHPRKIKRLEGSMTAGGRAS